MANRCCDWFKHGSLWKCRRGGLDRRISTSTFRGGVVGPHYAVPTRRQKGHLHSRGAAISHEITKACHAEAGDGAKRRVRGLSQRLTVYSRSNYQVTFSGMQKQRPTQLHKNGAGIMAVWLAWLPKVSAYWSKDGKWIPGKEVEHWHDGHLGEFYKKPREKFGELASEFGKAFKHSPEHKHPLAPPWWQFVIMFTLVVVALIGCIIWKVMADAERRFVEARQGRQQQRAQVSQALRQPTRRSTARNRGAEVGSAASRGDAALSIDRIQEED